MPMFDWEGQTHQGEFRRGVMEGTSVGEVETRLKQLQITPSKVKKKQKEIHINIPFLTRVGHKTLVVFTRQLATMIDAGLPLVQCLELLQQQEPDRNFQKVIQNVKASVEAGSTFAEALKKHPKVFDELYCNLVAAGEMGGILDTILNRLAAYAEKAMKLKTRIKSAMKYPMVIFFVSIGITIIMLVKVIPTFAQMFKSMGKKELPAVTQGVMNASNFTIANLHWILLAIVGSIVGFVMFRRWPPGRKILDTVALRIPVFGNLLRKSAVAKFTRTLGTLVASGVPILDGLEIVAKTAGNKVVEEGINYTREKISEGKSIAGPLSEMKVFPHMVVQMIAVGESTGAMDVMLGKIADFYDDEVDQAVEGITSMIEPLIMVFLGGLIGFLLLAMYMPIFSMADNIGGAGGN
jgi:type IV pilus assembly protein PilC